MAIQVASLYGVLKMQDDDFRRSAQNARGEMLGLGDRLKDVGQRVSGFGTQLTMMTAPLAAFGVAGIKTASDFQSAMAEISARTGLTGADLQRISDYALQMGADTAFSAQEAADAFLQLLSSGQTAEEAIATLPAVLDAAAASGEDLGRTADTVTDIMAMFGLDVEAAGSVVDALAQAAGASSADMASLGQGFANVGGVAKNFGLSVEDTAAVLAIFAENGVKGAEAGTQLKSMLLNMARPTDAVQGAWKRLGLSMYDANGNARPLEDVIRDLDTALDKLPVEEQNELMHTLAGSYGIVGLNALRGSISISEMQARMGEQAAAADVAQARMDTFAGRMDSLKGSVETLMIQAMTPFMENVLTPLVEQFTGVINQVTAWAAENPALTASIVGIGAALVALGPVVAGLGMVIGMLASPITLVIAGVAALGAAYATNFGGIRDFVDTQVRPILDKFFNFLGQAWETIRPGLEKIYEWFVTSALPAIQGFVENTVMPAIQRFIDILVGFWTSIQPGVDAFFNWVTKDALPLVVDFFTNTLQPVIDLFIDVLLTLWETVSPTLSSLFNWFMTDGLPFITDVIKGAMDNFITPFINLLKGIWDAIKPTFDALKTNLQGWWFWLRDNVWQPLIDKVQGVIDFVSDLLNKLGLVQQSSNDALNQATANTFPTLPTMPGRAGGGDVSAGMPYKVGEEGTELFVPGVSGTIVPNDALGGVTISNLTIHANNAAEGRAAAEAFETRLRELMRAGG